MHVCEPVYAFASACVLNEAYFSYPAIVPGMHTICPPAVSDDCGTNAGQQDANQENCKLLHIYMHFTCVY